MSLKGNTSYDERQIQVRGIAFKYGFVTFVIVVLVFELAKNLFKISATPIGEAFLIISIPYLITMSLFIIKDAYDPINSKPGIMIFTIMGILAVVFIVYNIFSNEQLIVNKVITNEGGLTVFYGTWILIAIIYWIKNIKNKKEEFLDNMISK